MYEKEIKKSIESLSDAIGLVVSMYQEEKIKNSCHRQAAIETMLTARRHLYSLEQECKDLYTTEASKNDALEFGKIYRFGREYLYFVCYLQNTDVRTVVWVSDTPPKDENSNGWAVTLTN